MIQFVLDPRCHYANQVSSIAHAVCFGFTHLSSFLHVAVHALLQFLGSGCIVATAYWFLANKYLTVVSPHRCRKRAACLGQGCHYAAGLALELWLL